MLTSSDVSKYKDKVESVVIGEGITELKSNNNSYDGTFRDFNNLKSVTFKVNSSEGISKLGSIGAYAFYGCKELQNITIPDSVTSIGVYAFRGCSSLTSVKFGDNSKLGNIERRTFWECSSLTSITIPDGVTSIGKHAFRGCSSLTSVKFGDNFKLKTIGECAFNGCSGLKSITIPDGVTSIGWGAFEECSSLTSITIPDGVTSIGWWASEECSSLTSVKFGDNSKLGSIGSRAFCNCNQLKNIEIPNTVTSIGELAFNGCNSLTDVYYMETKNTDYKYGTKEEWNKINIEKKGNENLTKATIHYRNILTLKKIWKDGGNGSKRGIPKFVLEKTLNNQRTELKEGSEADGGDYIELSCKYNDGASDVFEITTDDSGQPKKKIKAGAKGVEEWVYKFIVYDYDDKAKYAVEEEPMEGYKSEAFKKAGS